MVDDTTRQDDQLRGATAIQMIQDAGIDLGALQEAPALPVRDGVLRLVAQLPALRLVDIALILGRSNAAVQRAVRAHLASGTLCEYRLITGVSRRAVPWITARGQPPPTPAIQSTIDTLIPVLVTALAATGEVHGYGTRSEQQQHAPSPASVDHGAAGVDVIDAADVPTTALVLVPRVHVPSARPQRTVQRCQRRRTPFRLRWAMWRCGIVPLRRTVWQYVRGAVVGAVLVVLLISGLRWAAQRHGVLCPPSLNRVCQALVVHP